MWLNKFLKYKGRLLYEKEFSDTVIVDVQQIVGINSNFKSCDEIATQYNFTQSQLVSLIASGLYLRCVIIGN